MEALEPRSNRGVWALLTLGLKVKGQMIHMVAIFWESVQLVSTWKGPESAFASEEDIRFIASAVGLSSLTNNYYRW